MKILANDGMEASAKAALEQAGFEVHDVKIPQDELANHINEFDVLTVRSATKVRKPLACGLTVVALPVRACAPAGINTLSQVVVPSCVRTVLPCSAWPGV